MARVSVDVAFGWAQRFVAREWRLLVPVALAFLALPPIALQLLMPAELKAMTVSLTDPEAMVRTMRWLMPLSMLIALLGLAGGMALVALTVVPRLSVADAIRLAIGRLWVIAVASLTIIGAVAFGAVLCAILLSLLGVAAAREQSLLVGIVFAGLIVVSARLLLLTPVAIDRRLGPIASIRASWALTAGSFWRLLAIVLIYLVGSLVVLVALQSALGTILMLAARAIGWPDLGAAVMTLVTCTARAAISAFFYVLLGAIYRQLAGSSTAT